MPAICAENLLAGPPQASFDSKHAPRKWSMCERQLDLFSASGIPLESHAEPNDAPPQPIPADLDDAALIAAIPPAGVAAAPALAAEAGRRRLAAAITALEQLCLRFAGFGLERAVPEQVAALRALALIGGPESAQAVARLITRSIVQGPTRKVAVGIAARLNSALPTASVCWRSCGTPIPMCAPMPVAAPAHRRRRSRSSSI